MGLKQSKAIPGKVWKEEMEGESDELYYNPPIFFRLLKYGVSIWYL